MLAIIGLSLILERVLMRQEVVKYISTTFERGTVYSARFRQDGSVVYGAEWNGQPLELYLTVGGDSPQSQPLGLKSSCRRHTARNIRGCAVGRLES
jgi:hypothetical protein